MSEPAEIPGGPVAGAVAVPATDVGGAMDHPSGRVALVTGAASGIGLASSQALAGRGATVVLVDVTDGAGSEAASEVGGCFVHADVSDPKAWDEVVDHVRQHHGRLDVAHLNAGVSQGLSDVTRVSDAEYRRYMGVNIDGVFFGVRALVPLIEASGGGSIVVTASIAGMTPLARDPIYAMTKHAVVALVRSLATDLATRGISINAVCPGTVATGMVPPAARASLEGAGVHLLDPNDIADTVLSLVAPPLNGGGGTPSGARAAKVPTGQAVLHLWGRAPEPFRFSRFGEEQL